MAELINEVDARTRAAEVVEMPVGNGFVAGRMPVTERINPDYEDRLAGRDHLREYAVRAGWTAGQAVNATRNAVSTAASTTSDSARRVYRMARSRTRSSYEQLSNTTVQWMRATKAGADVAKNEFPLQTLGIIAGAAFLCGMGLRIWRNV